MSNKDPKTQRSATLGEDDRLSKQEDPARADRGAQDAQRFEDDGLAMTPAERMRMIRSEWMNEALPTPPKLAGWHLCWLTTNSNYDPLSKRLRLGYQLVRKSEMPSFETGVMDENKNSEFVDYVTCNEMILAKIPEELYQQIMLEFHHNMPLEGEEAIKSSISDNMRHEDSDGNRVIIDEEEGMRTLVQRRRAPAAF